MTRVRQALWVMVPLAWLLLGEGCNQTGVISPAGGSSGVSSGVGGTPVSYTPGGCNPLSGAPCDVDNLWTCDLDTGGSFTCFPPPNTALPCQPCHTADQPDFCVLGSTCLDSQVCAAFCCDDGDCGPSGRCDKSCLGRDDVGVCVVGDGAGGGGGASPACTPVCDVPMHAPSGGACVDPG